MTPIDHRITRWLNALELELAADDPAVRQDAVADAREHLLAARAELPATATDVEIAALLDDYGDPVEVANSYRDAERLLHGEAPQPSPTAAAALAPMSTPTVEPRRDGAGWFSIIRDPEAWTSLVYMLLALPIGIASFVFTVAGGSVSGSLLILVFGIPLALAFLVAIRGIALVHGRLVEVLLGERMPRRTRPITDEIGTKWTDRVKYWLRDRRTWTSIVFNITMLPLGIAYFVSAVTITSACAAALFGPVILWGTSHDNSLDLGWWQWVLSAVLIPAGALGFLGLLHLARFVGGLHGRYTKFMLVGGEGASRRRNPVAPSTSIARAAVFLGIAFVVAGTVSGAAAGSARTSTHETTVHLSARNLDTLVLDGNTADVDFVSDATVDPGAIEVVATLRVRDGHQTGRAVRLTQDGASATLHGSCAGRWLFMWSCDTKVRVHVAPTTAMELRGAVDTGDVTLDATWKRIDLQTDTGDVSGHVDAEHVSLKTDTGDIQGDFSDAVRRADLTTDTGDIQISAPGTWAVDSHADTGDVAIDVPTDGNADHTLRARTDTGDIQVGRR